MEGFWGFCNAYLWCFFFYLLTRFGSMMESPLEAVEGLKDGNSVLHELSTSPGSFFGGCWSRAAPFSSPFSSLLLFWSDGVDGPEDDTVGGTVRDMSSENIDMSWSSSNRSKPLAPCSIAAWECLASSTSTGASRKAMESLTDLRWEPRLEEEKSRNSSTQEGCWEVVVAVAAGRRAGAAMDGILWWGKEGQFWVMLGTFGGSCAILFARKMKLKLEVILNQKPHQRNESKEYKNFTNLKSRGE